mgnify:CR=1 FL=1
MSARKQRNQRSTDGDSSRLHSLFLFGALLAILFVDDGLGVDALQHTNAPAVGRRNVGERIAALDAESANILNNIKTLVGS